MYDKRLVRRFVIAAALFLITIIGISTFFIVEDLQKTALVKLVVAPISADITINGDHFTNMETYRLKPGDYEIVVSKPGYFKPFKKSFTLDSDETKEFYLELQSLPNTNWYEEHPDDSYSIDTIISHESSETHDYLAQNYPLLKELPIEVEYYKNNSTYVYYTISSQIDEDNTPTVIINDYTGNNYNLAIDRIRAEGFSPEDYRIKYLDKTAEISPAFSPE